MNIEGLDLPPYSLVLMPWFYILRRDYGNNFDLNKFTVDDIRNLAPFSLGANSCIGRYLAIPLMESVLSNLLDYELKLIFAKEEYEGKVALKYKNSPVIEIS